MIFRKNSFLILLFVFSCGLLHAQKKTATEAQVKAVFLYNFTNFIDWPASAFESPDAPFVIGIIGRDPFGSVLDETVWGEKVGTHPIMVQRYYDDKDISRCHILFINLTDAGDAKRILSQIANQSILTISNAADFNKWGGMVRFYTENKKIRLQINVEAARASQLNISSKLLGVAQIF